MRVIRLAAFAALALVLAGWFGEARPAGAIPSIIRVDTTADNSDIDGFCSLREAIIASNTNSIADYTAFACQGTDVGDSIRFALGSGVPVINIGSTLPQISERVTISGNTGGATRVELRGPGYTSGVDAIVIANTAASTTVRYLVLNGFRTAVRVMPSATIIQASNVTLTSNYIGTDATGMTAQSNQYGVSAEAPAIKIGGTNGTTPGGACTGDCNVLAGFIRLKSQNALVQGNFIGVNTAGDSLLGALLDPATQFSATIGGDTPEARNVIADSFGGININGFTGTSAGVSITIKGNYIGTNSAGNASLSGFIGIQVEKVNGTPIDILNNVVSGGTGNGIEINASSNVRLFGNYIGTRADGVTPLSNAGHGVLVESDRFGDVSHDNVIGGAGPGEGNVIAFNGGDGVRVDRGSGSIFDFKGNFVRGNSIYDNIGLGINNIDVVCECGPVITEITASSVSGTTFACSNCATEVDVFSDAGYEGKTYHGTALADTNGDWTLNVAPVGPRVTATFTYLYGTSEFTAACLDQDSDIICDAQDNCDNWPNGDQVLPPWPVPATDSDCDGFTTAREQYLGTEWLDQCSTDSGANNEGPPDRWPVDFDDNRIAGLADVQKYIPVFNTAVPQPPGTDPAKQRFDLDGNGFVGLADVQKFIPFFNRSCSG